MIHQIIPTPPILCPTHPIPIEGTRQQNRRNHERLQDHEKQVVSDGTDGSWRGGEGRIGYWWRCIYYWWRWRWFLLFWCLSLHSSVCSSVCRVVVVSIETPWYYYQNKPNEHCLPSKTNCHLPTPHPYHPPNPPPPLRILPNGLPSHDPSIRHQIRETQWRRRSSGIQTCPFTSKWCDVMWLFYYV